MPYSRTVSESCASGPAATCVMCACVFVCVCEACWDMQGWSPFRPHFVQVATVWCSNGQSEGLDAKPCTCKDDKTHYIHIQQLVA